MRKPIIVLEGCDGAGKSTLAGRIASMLNEPTAIFHHGSYVGLTGHEIAQKYVDSMLPALYGDAPVILDRCWHSEAIYGAVYRNGLNRLTTATVRMLDRLALTCGGAMVLCDPGRDGVIESFRQRRQLEMLDDEKQLLDVWNLYDRSRSFFGRSLNTVNYSYKDDRVETLMDLISDKASRIPESVDSNSIFGRWGASSIVVSHGTADVSCAGPTQPTGWSFPFVSFSNSSYSAWLTNLMSMQNVCERQILWAHGGDLTWIKTYRTGATGLRPKILALGPWAATKLAELGVQFTHAMHPEQAALEGLNIDLPRILG